MSKDEQIAAGFAADRLLAAEAAIQDRMWGDGNERADAEQNQLPQAAVAQLILLAHKLAGVQSSSARAMAAQHYPEGWSGFRDYGSNIANLVVAGAFIRSEIKRRLLMAEDTTRTKRTEDQPYNPATGLPYVSAEQAAAEINHPV